jgi:hypothetical protein
MDDGFTVIGLITFWSNAHAVDRAEVVRAEALLLLDDSNVPLMNELPLRLAPAPALA